MSGIKIKITQDMRLIASIMEDPDLFDRISNDISETVIGEELIEALNLTSYKYLYFIVYNKDNKEVGFFACHEEEGALEVHINMLSPYRGKFATEASKIFISTIFSYTEYKTLLAVVPSKYIGVIKFVSSLGFKLTHMTESNYLKNGIRYPTFHFVLDKKE